MSKPLIFNNFNSEIIDTLNRDGIGVIPTDTVYGLVGKASSKKAVERIYEVKGRDLKKPLIILISSISNLTDFNIKLNKETKEILNRYWPGKVSIILPCKSKGLEYLHRGTNSLAFRLPNNKELKDFIKKTGPLVAPSANPEGKEIASNIKEAQSYFKNSIDFYLDGGEINSSPSAIISVQNGEVILLRKRKRAANGWPP